MILCSAVLMEHRLVTDGRTDRQTLGYSIYRASIASRDKKTESRLVSMQRLVAAKLTAEPAA